MSLRAKRRLVFAALLMLAAWPPVHYELVARYELNPWKFFGWSMYCTPHNIVSVELFETRGERRVRLRTEGLGPEVHERINGFRDTRTHLGTLVKPHGIAAALFRSRPDLEGLEIVVQNLRLSPETDRFEALRRSYRYERRARRFAAGGS